MKKQILIVFMLISWTILSFSSTKELTVMIYMNGDNDLESYGIYNICDMEKAGSDENVNFIVQFDRSENHDVSNGNWSGAKRFYIEKAPEDAKAYTYYSKPVEDLGKIDMGDPQTAVDFFKWSVENYPAKKYAFIFWNHGSGWLKSARDLSPVRGISYDDDSGNHIDSVELKYALSKMKDINKKKIDIIGFDACLMAMIEVAAQLSDYSDYMVASEASEPASGWKYDLIFNSIKEEYSLNPEKISLNITKALIEEYDGSTDWMYLKQVTFSCIDLNKISDILKNTSEFVDSIINTGNFKVLSESSEKTQSFTVNYFIDYIHFIKNIISKTKDHNIKKSGEKLISSIEDSVLLNWWQNDKMKDSHGISVYFPEKEKYKEHYTDTEFSKKTKWDRLIKKSFK